MGIPVRVGVLVAAVGGGRLPARDATASTPFAFLLEDVKIGASGSAEPASITTPGDFQKESCQNRYFFTSLKGHIRRPFPATVGFSFGATQQT